MKIEKVCIYCASSKQIDRDYITDVVELGKILALEHIEVIYGGGSVGAMGALADAVLENNGRIIGVIPKFMMELEWGNPHITQLIVVENMAERKQQFINSVDAVIALPGGTGTLEELAEVISLKKLGLFTKPIIILNTKGFYDTLIQFIDRMISDNFIRDEHRNIFSVINKPDEVIKAINNAPLWDDSARDLAAL